jgi:hypothetical protein
METSCRPASLKRRFPVGLLLWNRLQVGLILLKKVFLVGLLLWNRAFPKRKLLLHRTVPLKMLVFAHAVIIITPLYQTGRLISISSATCFIISSSYWYCKMTEIKTGREYSTHILCWYMHRMFWLENLNGATRVELGYNDMQGTEYFISL